MSHGPEGRYFNLITRTFDAHDIQTDSAGLAELCDRMACYEMVSLAESTGISGISAISVNIDFFHQRKISHKKADKTDQDIGYILI